MCDNVWQCFRNLDYSITIYQISGLQYIYYNILDIWVMILKYARYLDCIMTIYQISGLQYYCNSRLNIQVRDSNTVCQISGLYKYCSMLNIQDNSQVSEAFPILKKRYLGYSITVCQILQYVRYLYYSITRCLISGLQCYRMLNIQDDMQFCERYHLKKIDIWVIVLLYATCRYLDCSITVCLIFVKL